jgi:SAM-dependent methyltransferase
VSVERFFQSLRPAPDGVAQVPFATSYLPVEGALNWSEELETLHAEDHFIDALTRRAVVGVLGRAGPGPEAVVADVGCSSGVLLGDLAVSKPGWVLVGVDALLPALERAHGAVPTASLFHASAADLPFGDETVDALLAVNVLEHIDDDTRALREFRRVLKPHGRAVVVVPWNRRLYDAYDAFLRHERRYSRGELRRKAREADLNPVETRYVGTLVYPGFWAVKTYGRVRHRRGGGATAQAIVSRRIGATRRSRLAIGASRLEEGLSRHGLRLPFGIRELSVLRRR